MLRNPAPRRLPAACLCVSARRQGRKVVVSASNRAAMRPFFTSACNLHKTLPIRVIDNNILLPILAIHYVCRAEAHSASG